MIGRFRDVVLRDSNSSLQEMILTYVRQPRPFGDESEFQRIQ